MHVLVTGGAGFIGSHVCDALLSRGEQVTALDNFDPFYPAEVKWANIEQAQDERKFALVEGDIRNAELVGNLFARGGFDAVVHLAALAGVRESISDPYGFNEVNVDGVLRIMDACVKHGNARFILASTSSVYGLSSRVPYREDDPLMSPVSPYGASKIAAEKYAAIYHHVHGLDTISLRLFTAYGERQRPDMAIHKFARLITQDKPVPVYGDGSSERDYTYVGDVIGAILQALDSGIAHGVYNIGNNITYSLSDVIAEIGRALEREPQLEFQPEQPGDPPCTCADFSKAQAELGYNPRTALREGIGKFVEWLVK